MFSVDSLICKFHDINPSVKEALQLSNWCKTLELSQLAERSQFLELVHDTLDDVEQVGDDVGKTSQLRERVHSLLSSRTTLHYGGTKLVEYGYHLLELWHHLLELRHDSLDGGTQALYGGEGVVSDVAWVAEAAVHLLNQLRFIGVDEGAQKEGDQ